MGFATAYATARATAFGGARLLRSAQQVTTQKVLRPSILGLAIMGVSPMGYGFRSVPTPYNFPKIRTGWKSKGARVGVDPGFSQGLQGSGYSSN